MLFGNTPGVNSTVISFKLLYLSALRGVDYYPGAQRRAFRSRCPKTCVTWAKIIGFSVQVVLGTGHLGHLGPLGHSGPPFRLPE